VIVQSLVVAAALSLGRAESFSILGGSGVTSSGATRVTGNVGAGSGRVTGVSPVVGDVLPGGDALKDVATAWDALASQQCPHCVASLDGDIDDNGIWIIHVRGDLTTLPDSSIRLLNGAKSRNVFWLVDGAAILGDRSSFVGTLIAQKSITLGQAVTVSGRLFARQGMVTLATDDINFCCDPIAQSPLPNGAVNRDYLSQIIADGGTAPHTFSLFAETDPPPGLHLDSDGTLHGSPAAAGSYTFIVLVRDYNGCTSIHTHTIVICGGSAPEPVKLPDGTVGTTYGVVVGVGGASFRVTKLPLWMTPVPTRCFTEILLIGTPTAEGPYTIELADCDGHCVTKIYTIDVHCPAITFTPPDLPSATVGVLYKESVAASGGTAPYRYDPSSEVSFTPNKPGPYSFSVRATDAYGCSGQRDYTIDAGCPPITITPATLPDGAINLPYSVQLSGGPLPGHYTFTPIQLPAGLTLSPEGLLLGPPTVAGDETVIFAVTNDDSTCGAGPIAMPIRILPCPTIIVSPEALPHGTLFVFYSKVISASGGTPPYVMTVTGLLPPGITPPSPPNIAPLTLSGIPMVTGSYTFTVTATDSQGCSGFQTYTIVIRAPLVPGPVIPTLSEWMLLLLAIVLAYSGFVLIRRESP